MCGLCFGVMDQYTHPAVSEQLQFFADGTPYFVAYCRAVGTSYYHEITPRQLASRVFWQIKSLDMDSREVLMHRRHSNPK